MHVLLLIFSHFQPKTITTTANSSNTCLQPQKLQNQTKLKERVLPRVALTYDSPLKEQLESEKEKKSCSQLQNRPPVCRPSWRTLLLPLIFLPKDLAGNCRLCVCARRYVKSAISEKKSSFRGRSGHTLLLFFLQEGSPRFCEQAPTKINFARRRPLRRNSRGTGLFGNLFKVAFFFCSPSTWGLTLVVLDGELSQCWWFFCWCCSKGGTFFRRWFMHAQNKAHFSDSTRSACSTPHMVRTGSAADTTDCESWAIGPLGRTSRLVTLPPKAVKSERNFVKLEKIVKHNLNIDVKKVKKEVKKEEYHLKLLVRHKGFFFQVMSQN